jgi:hypothetical protein
VKLTSVNSGRAPYAAASPCALSKIDIAADIYSARAGNASVVSP